MVVVVLVVVHFESDCDGFRFFLGAIVMVVVVAGFVIKFSEWSDGSEGDDGSSGGYAGGDCHGCGRGVIFQVIFCSCGLFPTRNYSAWVHSGSCREHGNWLWGMNCDIKG